MTEPLTDEQIGDFKRWADRLADGPCNGCRIASKSLAALLAEVERLKAREADLVADIDLIGVGLVKRISDMEATL